MSAWIDSLFTLLIKVISNSRLCEITSFTGSTDSVRTVFSEAVAKMSKEEEVR